LVAASAAGCSGNAYVEGASTSTTFSGSASSMSSGAHASSSSYSAQSSAMMSSSAHSAISNSTMFSSWSSAVSSYVSSSAYSTVSSYLSSSYVSSSAYSTVSSYVSSWSSAVSYANSSAYSTASISRSTAFMYSAPPLPDGSIGCIGMSGYGVYAQGDIVDMITPNASGIIEAFSCVCGTDNAWHVPVGSNEPATICASVPQLQ
jgi:hypothetical protein